jgi:hypothetical protein
MQPFDLPYWEGKIEEYAREGCAWWLRPGNPPATVNESWIIRICRMGDPARDCRMMDPPRPEAITAIADCLGGDPREDDHRRPPANGDEYWANVGYW